MTGGRPIWRIGVMEELRWPSAALTDGTLWLDRPVAADVTAIVAACQDAEAQRWLPLPSPYGEREAQEWLRSVPEEAAKGLKLEFAVREEQGSPMVAAIGLHFRQGPGVVKLGYWVTPRARNRGMAAGAVRLLATYALNTFGPRRVEILVQPENVASCRVAQRTGATFEGVRRAGMEDRDRQPIDANVYSLLPDDLD